MFATLFKHEQIDFIMFAAPFKHEQIDFITFELPFKHYQGLYIVFKVIILGEIGESCPRILVIRTFVMIMNNKVLL